MPRSLSGVELPYTAVMPVGITDAPITGVPGLFTRPAPDWFTLQDATPSSRVLTPEETWRQLHSLLRGIARRYKVMDPFP